MRSSIKSKKSAGKLQLFHIKRHITQTKSHANIPVVKLRSHDFYKFSKTFTWIGFDHVLHFLMLLVWKPAPAWSFALDINRDSLWAIINSNDTVWSCQHSITFRFCYTEEKGFSTSWTHPLRLSKSDQHQASEMLSFSSSSSLSTIFWRSVQCPRRKIWHLGQRSQM